MEGGGYWVVVLKILNEGDMEEGNRVFFFYLRYPRFFFPFGKRLLFFLS